MDNGHDARGRSTASTQALLSLTATHAYLCR